jgi:uncharacterized protein (TIGR02391 family)
MIKSFEFSVLESLAKIIGDTREGFTGSQIGSLLAEKGFPDPLNGATKWKRLYESFVEKQSNDRCANHIGAFIEHAMSPARHYDRQEWYSDTKYKLNQILSFAGIELGENGKLKSIEKAHTISEAKARASKLKESLLIRNVHLDVLLFCREELLVDNYFHAVFEATKSVAEKIRKKTGLTSDGSALIDDAFSFKNKIPHLALNSLETESQQSEQKGFLNLLKGLFGTFRNTTAHAPKIMWSIQEQDALDILSMVSLVHRRLDGAIEAQKMYQGKSYQ